MSITELKVVLDGLPPAEQERLLRHLEANLRRQPGGNGSHSKEEWMARLDTLRGTIGSANPALTGEQILNELRDE